MTKQDVLDAMGNLASEAEAAAMVQILSERGIDDLRDMPDWEFFDLIPEAIARAI